MAFYSMDYLALAVLDIIRDAGILGHFLPFFIHAYEREC
jgi:hypothetical protein